MTNYNLLQQYLQLQFDIMFDKLIRLDYATIVYCKDELSVYWNYALMNRLLTTQELVTIEKTLTDLKRRPTLYFENNEALKGLMTLLQAKGYKKVFEDAWMFYQNNTVDTRNFNNVKKVDSLKELKIYLNTFNNSYQKDDPQNPYGEIGKYLKTAKEAWMKHSKSDRIEYFVVYDDSKPSAVSTLTNYNDIGYISNVGSLQEARGKGFGKLATLYCVLISQKRGNNVHCLATEEGTYPNDFYKRIGFQTKFKAGGYSKE